MTVMSLINLLQKPIYKIIGTEKNGYEQDDFPQKTVIVYNDPKAINTMYDNYMNQYGGG